MTTQDHLPIKEIHDSVAILKDGSIVVVLQTSAVNFDLLSENEQLAIISTFAAMLNSLSFAIQIVIRSKRLDISSYINLLKRAEQEQTNPLLNQMMQRYRTFIETIIRDNEVLDKQFFITLSVSSLEVGLGGSKEQKFQKAMTILLPRRDHIMRQISRIGLKVEQLTDERLARLFFDLYNELDLPPVDPEQQSTAPENAPSATITVIANAPEQTPPPAQESTQPSIQPLPPLQPPPQTMQQPTPQPQPQTTLQPTNISTSSQPPKSNYSSPFIVEELPEEYSSV